MGVTKIDPIRLKELIDRGLKQCEIAKEFNVTASGICRKMKELKLSLASNVTLQKAGEIVDNKLNALEQLLHINQVINAELDGIITDDKRKKELPWQDLIIKHSAEIRKQLQLQLEIYKALYDIEAVKEFQREVLDAIGRADPEIREQIIHNLQERRIVRGAVDLLGE